MDANTLVTSEAIAIRGILGAGAAAKKNGGGGFRDECYRLAGSGARLVGVVTQWRRFA